MHESIVFCSACIYDVVVKSSRSLSHLLMSFLSRSGEKYYIYFVDNSLPFPTVKEFSESLLFDEVIAKIRHRVFETQCIRRAKLHVDVLSVCT